MEFTHSDIMNAARAIANARGMRRGMPAIKNIESLLTDKQLSEVIEDAEAALKTVEEKFTSTNSAMLKLLGDLRDYLGCGVENRVSDTRFIDQIDAVLAQLQQ